MKYFLFCILISLCLMDCKNKPTESAPETPVTEVVTPKTHSLALKWESDSVFAVPESVCFDPEAKVLYVSNIDGKDPWGADGKGSIGKLGLDGKVIQAHWVSGMNAPKGMAIHQKKLYVADLKEIVVIDIPTGKIDFKIKVPGAIGLNDISADASGVLYVTDSQGKRLYRVESGSSALVLDSLKGPNGVLVRGKDLFILENGGMYKVNQAANSIDLMTDGLEGGADGLEPVNAEDFIISCWAGTIWYLNGDGRKEMVFDGKSVGKNTADIGFDPSTNMVYVPTFWRNSVMAFEIVTN
jgi:DNA-binding beta-propeller fold protein YncE